MKTQIAIAGAGPAGLATAIHAARRGFEVVVIDRHEAPIDKACGEGLMPSGLSELRALGAHVEGAPFRGIRYVQEDGRSVEARFRHGDGLGLRRLALSRALETLARDAGARRIRASIHGVSNGVLQTDGDPIEAQLIVGADGLASPVRAAAGLEGAPRAVRRFGVRAHLRRRPEHELVEVHWSAGAEAYLTPVGPEEINVAVLWEPALLRARSLPDLLAHFPRLQLGTVTRLDESGAGPLARSVRATVGERVALVGDAAGYVDAITGQGVSLALAGARLLVERLPQSLEAGALRVALTDYARTLRREYLAYARPASALLWLARRPRLRRRAMQLLTPRTFERLLDLVW